MGDWVVSGPLYPATGRGRTFLTPHAALRWAVRKYGENRVTLLPQSLNPKAVRWAILVRKAK